MHYWTKECTSNSFYVQSIFRTALTLEFLRECTIYFEVDTVLEINCWVSKFSLTVKTSFFHIAYSLPYLLLQLSFISFSILVSALTPC